VAMRSPDLPTIEGSGRSVRARSRRVDRCRPLLLRQWLSDRRVLARRALLARPAALRTPANAEDPHVLGSRPSWAGHAASTRFCRCADFAPRSSAGCAAPAATRRPRVGARRRAAVPGPIVAERATCGQQERPYPATSTASPSLSASALSTSPRAASPATLPQPSHPRLVRTGTARRPPGRDRDPRRAQQRIA